MPYIHTNTKMKTLLAQRIMICLTLISQFIVISEAQTAFSPAELEDSLFNLMEADRRIELVEFAERHIDWIHSDSLLCSEIFEFHGIVWFFLIDVLNEFRESEEIVRLFEEIIRNELDSLVKYNPYAIYSIALVVAPYMASSDKDKSQELIELALDIWPILEKDLFDSLAHFNLLGRYYHSVKDLRLSQSYFEKAKDFLSNPLADPLELSTTLSILGDIYKAQGQFDLAIENYDATIVMLNQLSHKDAMEWGIVFNNLGSIYLDIGDFQKANDFFIKAYLEFQSTNSKSRDLALSSRNIGITYLELGKIDDALRYLHEANDLETDLMDNNNLIRAITLNRLSIAYHELGNLEKARTFADQSHSILKPLPEGTHIGHRLSTLLSLVNVHYDLNEFEKCNTYISKGLNIASRDSLLKYEFLTFLFVRGKILFELGDNDQAIEVFESIIDEINENENLDKYLDLRLRCREWLSKLCLAQGDTSPDCGMRHLINACFDFMILLQTPTYLESKYELSNKHSDLFKNTIRSSLEVFEQHPDLIRFDQLNKLMRLLKNKQLFISLRSEIESNSELSLLKLSVAHLRDLRLKNPNNEQYLNQLVQTELDLSQIVSQLGTRFDPYQINAADFFNKDLSTLEEGTLTLNYFDLDSILLLAFQNGRQTGTTRIPYDTEIRAQISRTISDIKDPLISLDTIQLKALMEHLIPIECFKNEVTKILINADGILHFLPFEILAYRERLLIEEFAINYEMQTDSVSQDAEQYEHEYFGFYPDYRKYVPLEFAKSEIKAGQKILGGEIHESLSKQQLLDKIKGSRVSHMALHAEVNNNYPLDSRFIISDNDSIQTLSLREISSQRALSEIVILSACNSGNGFLYDSEGIASLGSAFSLAGSKYILTSLWDVNDYSSTTIISGYIKHLKQGKSKSQAIRHAKLAYLDQVKLNSLRHPYYWANFIHIGNDLPVSLDSNKPNYILISGILFAVIVFGSVFYFRASTNS